MDALDIEQWSAVLRQVKSPEIALDKRSLKAAMDRGAIVPVPRWR